MKKIEAVIFDWAGTTVDYGCLAPIHAMQKAFKQQRLDITLDEIRQPMGMLKIDHIKAILNMSRVKQHFHDVHGRDYQATDIDTIYQAFEKDIFSILDHHTNLMNGVIATQTYLRDQHIKIGSTTGYTKVMIDIVSKSANQQGYCPDFIISADEVKLGRPHPDMLQENMAKLGIKDARSMIKVGDTLVDIAEGLNAGCWSVGVIEGSSLIGLSEEEADRLSKDEFAKHKEKAKQQMLAAGAHYVINNLHELPNVIDQIQQKGI